MKKQFESKLQHDALACKYNFNVSLGSGERSEKTIIDVDASNVPISEFGLHHWRQIMFEALSSIILSQNQSKEIFLRKKPKPPPEYQMDRD